MSGQPVARGRQLLDLVDVTGFGGVPGVAVFHDEDVPPVRGRGEGFARLRGHLRQGRGLSRAEVAAAAFRAGQLGSTVMVVNALGRGPPQFMVVLKVIGHVREVRGGSCPSEGA